MSQAFRTHYDSGIRLFADVMDDGETNGSQEGTQVQQEVASNTGDKVAPSVMNSNGVMICLGCTQSGSSQVSP